MKWDKAKQFHSLSHSLCRCEISVDKSLSIFHRRRRWFSTEERSFFFDWKLSKFIDFRFSHRRQKKIRKNLFSLVSFENAKAELNGNLIFSIRYGAKCATENWKENHASDQPQKQEKKWKQRASHSSLVLLSTDEKTRKRSEKENMFAVSMRPHAMNEENFLSRL